MLAPVLQPLEARVPDFAQVAFIDQVLQVAHARNEPVGKGGHVPYAGAARGLVHVDSLRHGHADRFFAKHVAARCYYFQHDTVVVHVRHGHGHGVRLDGSQEPVQVRESRRDVPLRLPAGQ